jgi:hypothetical protein
LASMTPLPDASPVNAISLRLLNVPSVVPPLRTMDAFPAKIWVEVVMDCCIEVVKTFT